MDLVFFGLKSRGLYFLFLYRRRRFSFCFWCIIMYTRAIAFRTTRLKYRTNITVSTIEAIYFQVERLTQQRNTYILESFEAAPPVTLATLKLVSSVLSSSSCLSSSFLSFVLSSEHLTLPWNNQWRHVDRFKHNQTQYSKQHFCSSNPTSLKTPITQLIIAH